MFFAKKGINNVYFDFLYEISNIMVFHVNKKTYCSVLCCILHGVNSQALGEFLGIKEAYWAVLGIVISSLDKSSAFIRNMGIF